MFKRALIYQKSFMQFMLLGLIAISGVRECKGDSETFEILMKNRSVALGEMFKFCVDPPLLEKMLLALQAILDNGKPNVNRKKCEESRLKLEAINQKLAEKRSAESVPEPTRRSPNSLDAPSTRATASEAVSRLPSDWARTLGPLLWQ